MPLCLDPILALLEGLKPGDAIPDQVVQEILSWDMTDVPHYTAAELMEPVAGDMGPRKILGGMGPISVFERGTQSMAPAKRKRDSQH
jgi:hypothetical protein